MSLARRVSPPMARLKLRLITVLWGAAFVDTFLRIGLRSLMAEGNILDLARSNDVVYTIFTTQDDAKLMQASPLFARLERTIDVRISIFTPAEIDPTNYGSHNILWIRGVDLAKRNRQIVFFIIPDILYGKGTLTRWAMRLADGYRALYSPGPQVVLETLLPALEAKNLLSDGSISVEKPELDRLLLQHFHPMHAALLRDAPRRMVFPEYDLRAVQGRGLVIRELTAQPFCFDPSHFTQMRSYSPIDHLDDIVVEECTTLSVEPLCKRLECYFLPQRLDGTRISQLGNWWDFFVPLGCERDSETVHGITLANDVVWRNGRDRAGVAGRLLRAQLMFAAEFYRVTTALRYRHGLISATTVMIAGMYFAQLRRTGRIRPGATLLVPHDDAFAGTDGEAVWQLLKPGRERELRDLILGHVISDTSGPTGTGEVKTAQGLPLVALASGAKVLQGPIFVGDLTVYVVDRILLPNRSAGAPGTASRPAADRMFTPAPSGDSLFGIWGYSAWAKSSLARRAIYTASHIPAIEPLVPLFIFCWSRLKKALLMVMRLCARIVRLTISGARRLLRHVPLRRPLSLLLALVRKVRAEGPKAAASKGYARIARKLGWAREPAAAIAPAPAPAPPNTEQRQPASADLALYREIRLARGLLAVGEILTHYSQAILPQDLPSAPLALVKKQLSHGGLTDGSAHDTIVRALEDLLSRNPGWLECWCELGAVREADGQMDEALKCYDQAILGSPMSPRAAAASSPRADAYASRARILAARDKLEDAASDYAACIDLDPEKRIARIEYSEVLRRLGRYHAIATVLPAAVHHEYTVSGPFDIGRDATDIVLQKLVVYAQAADRHEPRSSSMAQP